MKIEKPEIITEAYYIVCDALYVCVMVDVDHHFLDFVISHPPPHEKKLNSLSVSLTIKKNIYCVLANNNPEKTC